MGSIVRYHNDLNKLIFKTFNINELDIFYTIIFKMKNQSEAFFTVEEIKKLTTTEGKNRSLQRFFKYLDNVFKTQLQIKDEEGITDYNLFISKRLDEKRENITIKLNPDCIYILKDLFKNFTKFELNEFLSLKSEYSKTLFRYLKQFENSKDKMVIFKIDDFRLLINIPDSYEQYNINQKVLKPMIKELRTIYPKLDYEKEIKKGRKITHIIFYIEGKTELKEVNRIQKKYTQEVENLFKTLPASEQIESKKETLEKLLKKHSFQYLKADICYIKKKAPKDFWSYFNTSISNGHYGKDDIEKEKLKEEIENEEKKTLQAIFNEELTEEEKQAGINFIQNRGIKI